MKNLKELVSTVYNICINTNKSITTNSPFALLEKELTEYSKDLLIEFAKHIHNRLNLGENLYISDIEKIVSDYYEKEKFNQKAFYERVMTLLGDKEVKTITVPYNVYKEFGYDKKVKLSTTLKNNEIIIEY